MLIDFDIESSALVVSHFFYCYVWFSIWALKSFIGFCFSVSSFSGIVSTSGDANQRGSKQVSHFVCSSQLANSQLASLYFFLRLTFCQASPWLSTVGFIAARAVVLFGRSNCHGIEFLDDFVDFRKSSLSYHVIGRRDTESFLLSTEKYVGFRVFNFHVRIRQTHRKWKL